jgi:hypothetical protein
MAKRNWTRTLSAADKAIKNEVNRIVGRALANRPIRIMDITKVYDRAYYFAGNGLTGDQLEANLTDYVQSIEVKTQVAS